MLREERCKWFWNMTKIQELLFSFWVPWQNFWGYWLLVYGPSYVSLDPDVMSDKEIQHGFCACVRVDTNLQHHWPTYITHSLSTKDICFSLVNMVSGTYLKQDCTPRFSSFCNCSSISSFNFIFMMSYLTWEKVSLRRFGGCVMTQ